MIQRRQTLFLFQLVFLGIALLFVPLASITTNMGNTNLYMVPLANDHLSSTTGHLAAVAINFIGLILACITVFIYRRRELQMKLCYALMIIWLVLTLMMAFCPFVEKTDTVVAVENTYYGTLIGVFGMLAAYLAARYIKKDIELLKSADRVR